MNADCELDFEDGGDQLRVTLWERGVGQGEGDTRLRVTARTVGFEEKVFSGSAGIWIAQPAAQAFVTALAALEEARRGSATLRSMSPEEFLLNVSVIDSAGHVAVHGFLRKQARDHRGGQIDFNLAVPPDTLPRLLRRAQELLLGPG